MSDNLVVRYPLKQYGLNKESLEDYVEKLILDNASLRLVPELQFQVGTKRVRSIMKKSRLVLYVRDVVVLFCEELDVELVHIIYGAEKEWSSFKDGEKKNSGSTILGVVVVDIFFAYSRGEDGVLQVGDAKYKKFIPNKEWTEQTTIKTFFPSWNKGQKICPELYQRGGFKKSKYQTLRKL